MPGYPRQPAMPTPTCVHSGGHGAGRVARPPERCTGGLISGDGKSVIFQQISGYNPPRWPDPAHPQQAHPDFLIDDLDPVRPGHWSWAPPT